MRHHLIIEKFGKIEHADIQMAPFTLFVGDNNSGKSYLLSLLWGIYTADESSVLFTGLRELKLQVYEEIYGKLCHLLQNSDGNQGQKIKISSVKFLEVLNAALKKNKNRFVSEIFNSEQVSIQHLSVEIQENFEVIVESWKEGKHTEVSFAEKNSVAFSEGMMEQGPEMAVRIAFRHILLWFLKGNIRDYYSSNVVYLPAARTGFMLTRNIINKVGRQAAYNVSGLHDMGEKEDMEPFTRPIIHFLDILESLSLEHKTKYGEIADWITQNMTHGELQYGSDANRNEIRYVPQESEISLPLRTTSAVVTELTPLLLILKYKRMLNTVCYEEPEMCLHPKLQQEMGRLLVRLVNSGISMIVTTHSDIIVQHINNMCSLKEKGASEELLEKLGLNREDLMDIRDVAVYQFTDKGMYSEMERILPVDGEFRVATFTNALMKILEQTSEVQDFEGE